MAKLFNKRLIFAKAIFFQITLIKKTEKLVNEIFKSLKFFKFFKKLYLITLFPIRIVGTFEPSVSLTFVSNCSFHLSTFLKLASRLQSKKISAATASRKYNLESEL